MRDVVAPNVVDPSFAAKLPEPETLTWDVDFAAGYATPQKPLPRLGRPALPLDPMVGCFGVAPALGQAISTATSGPHGGNMDYRGFRAGTTAYFPVAAAGALFFIGDGHAMQGDGEIVGTGIEISFEVEFRLRVLKGKQIGWPRGENADYIFTVGNARPLDQALQHATTEMLGWLTQDYGLTLREASILLGQLRGLRPGQHLRPGLHDGVPAGEEVAAGVRTGRTTKTRGHKGHKGFVESAVWCELVAVRVAREI